MIQIANDKAYCALVFSALVSACGGGGGAPADPTAPGAPGASASETRDAAYWPFAVDSPWNKPIGSGARYAPVDSPLWTDASGGIVQYSINLTTSSTTTEPIFVASTSDPLRNIYQNGRGVVYTQHVPDAAAVDLSDGSSGDQWMQLIDETHRYVIEMFQASKRANGDWEAGFPNKIDLQGSGISPNNSTYIGSCAYGGSCIAGLIRKGEISGGIRHALRMSIDTGVLNKNGPDGKPFVWPAVSADDGDGRSYTGRSNVYMGTLLAIPASVDITKIPGVGTSGPAYELARTLQDYGAYVCDRGYFNIYSDVDAGPEVRAALGPTFETMKLIGKSLQVVANNGPSAVGGGGTPRRGPAPAFK